MIIIIMGKMMITVFITGKIITKNDNSNNNNSSDNDIIVVIMMMAMTMIKTIFITIIFPQKRNSLGITKK